MRVSVFPFLRTSQHIMSHSEYYLRPLKSTMGWFWFFHLLLPLYQESEDMHRLLRIVSRRWQEEALPWILLASSRFFQALASSSMCHVP